MKQRWLTIIDLYAGRLRCRGLVLVTGIAVADVALALAGVGPASAVVDTGVTTGSEVGETAAPAGTGGSAPAPIAAAAKSQAPDSAETWRPPTPASVTVPAPVDSGQARQLAEQWGVQLLSLNLSAAGYMMDFRFRVLDADKALPLFDHRIKPYVVVERSNARLPVPMAAKVGAFRTTNRGKNIKADRNYYMMFANPDRHVKAGDKVNVIIGDFKVERLTVN